MGSGMDLESRTREIGRELLADVRQRRDEVFSRRFWSDRFMQRAMQDDAFKVQLFRFVDVFPALRSPEAVYDCLVEYLSQPGVTLPPGMEIGLKAGSLAKGMLSKTIGRWIAAIAGNFIAGADAASALPKLHARWRQGVAFTVDLLGEACVSPIEAAVYQRRYRDLIRSLPPAVRLWPANPALDSDHLGPVPRVNLSVKIRLARRPDQSNRQRRGVAAIDRSAAADPRRGRRQRRLRQLRHGAIRPEGPHDRIVPAVLPGGRFSRRNRHPGLPAKRRGGRGGNPFLGEAAWPASHRPAD